MQGAIHSVSFYGGGSGDSLFARIAKDIETQGYSINSGAMPEELTAALWDHLSHMKRGAFCMAGVGRASDYLFNRHIRSDEICWITGESIAGRQWLKWSAELQQFLNCHLFLGLFSFESHFSHYAPGTFYARHLDAFHGKTNRLLSLIFYINRIWKAEDGGELVLYRGEEDSQGMRVSPSWGTIVVFLSEEFPHEVLPANRDRYSIAGWYHLNSSTLPRVHSLG